MDSVLDRSLLHIPRVAAWTQPATHLLCHPAGSRHDHGENTVSCKCSPKTEFIFSRLCVVLLFWCNSLCFIDLTCDILCLQTWFCICNELKKPLVHYTDLPEWIIQSFLHTQIQADVQHTVMRCYQKQSNERYFHQYWTKNISTTTSSLLSSLKNPGIMKLWALCLSEALLKDMLG